MTEIKQLSPKEITLQKGIQIVDDLLEELVQGLPLAVSHDFSPITSDPQHAEVVLYQICGQDNIRKSQPSNLKQKLQEMQKALPMNQSNQQQQTQQIYNKFRYYSDTIRCFKCQKVGHLNFACPTPKKCFFCLSPDHNTQKCDQRIVCYRCYECGHMNSQCRMRLSPPCKYCRREHPGTCNFLLKGIEQIKQHFNYEYLSKEPDIRCMKCFEYGHLFCQPNQQQNPT